MSGYFDKNINRISDGTTARDAHVNVLRDEVGAGFDKLPTEDHLKTGRTTYAVDSGVANAYVVALPHSPAALVDGLEVKFRATNTNTGASTLDVGLGAVALKRGDNTHQTAGDIQAGSIIAVAYSSTYAAFVVTSASRADVTAAAGSATAAAGSATAAAGSATAAAGSATAALDAAASFGCRKAATVGGTVDAITATFSPVFQDLGSLAGAVLAVPLFGANATTTPTLTVDATAAKAIVKWSNTALAAEDIPGGDFVGLFVYDASLDKYQMLNPVTSLDTMPTITG